MSKVHVDQTLNNVSETFDSLLLLLDDSCWPDACCCWSTHCAGPGAPWPPPWCCHPRWVCWTHSPWCLASPSLTCGPSGPLSAKWVTMGHNGSQCVTMCRCPGPSLDWTLAAVFSPGPACAADTCDAQAGESSLPHHISDAVNVIIILSHMSKHDTLKWEGKYLHALNSQKSAISSLSNCIIMYNGKELLRIQFDPWYNVLLFNVSMSRSHLSFQLIFLMKVLEGPFL